MRDRGPLRANPEAGTDGQSHRLCRLARFIDMIANIKKETHFSPPSHVQTPSRIGSDGHHGSHESPGTA